MALMHESDDEMDARAGIGNSSKSIKEIIQEYTFDISLYVYSKIKKIDDRFEGIKREINNLKEVYKRYH